MLVFLWRLAAMKYWENKADKLMMMPDGKLVNQLRAKPFNVVGKYLHQVDSQNICTVICALYAAR